MVFSGADTVHEEKKYNDVKLARRVIFSGQLSHRALKWIWLFKSPISSRQAKPCNYDTDDMYFSIST